MKSKLENIDFESVFREKLNAVEYPYDSLAWKQFKKRIPGKRKFSYSIAAAFIIGILIIGASAYLIQNSHEKQENKTFDNKIEIVEVNNRAEMDEVRSESEIDHPETEKVREIEMHKLNKEQISSEVHVESDCKEKNEANMDVIGDNDIVNEKVENIIKKEEQVPSAGFCFSDYSDCEPVSVSFTPKEISDTIIYLWDFGDGTFSNDRKPDHLYSVPGEYIVTLTTKYYHSEKINTFGANKKIIIHPKPDASFEWANEYDSKCRFVAINTEYPNYCWEVDNQIYYSRNLEFDFESEGKYPVRLIVSNEFNCTDTTLQEVTVEVDFKIHMPSGFTPDGDGRNDLFGVFSSIQNVASFAFNIYNSAGQLVFTSDNINNRWDGNIMNSNIEADANIYFWEYSIKTESGKIVKDKGKVTLIRK